MAKSKKTRVDERAPDGPGGFVVKNGEHDGLFVAIFPAKFDKLFKKVTIIPKKGKKENLRCTGWGSPESNGKERQHWRGKKTVQQYGNGTEVKAIEAGVVHVWTIKNASSGRVD